MKKYVTILLSVAGLLIITSIASLLVQPAQASKTKKIQAGSSTLLVPLSLPGEIRTGNGSKGSLQIGSRDVCDITYDSFTGVYWSDRLVTGPELLPTPAYAKESEQSGTIDLGQGRKASTRTIKMSAEKPCGKLVKETLNVIDLYCSGSQTHYSIVGMEDPFMTQQRVLEIARTLECS